MEKQDQLYNKLKLLLYCIVDDDDQNEDYEMKMKIMR